VALYPLCTHEIERGRIAADQPGRAPWANASAGPGWTGRTSLRIRRLGVRVPPSALAGQTRRSDSRQRLRMAHAATDDGSEPRPASQAVRCRIRLFGRSRAPLRRRRRPSCGRPRGPSLAGRHHRAETVATRAIRQHQGPTGLHTLLLPPHRESLTTARATRPRRMQPTTGQIRGCRP